MLDQLSPPAITLQSLDQLYRNIDNQVRKLIRLHGTGLKCGQGCSACCVDDLSVFQVEADNIRFHYAALFKESIPHAAGACAFLNEQGACRIYDCRPYVCRTQGLPLHWIEHDENGRSVALRDICPLNEKGVAVESLPKEECWRIGPAEEVLAKLQYGAYKGSLTRVKLRELFAQ